MTLPRPESLLNILAYCRAMPGERCSDAELLARFTGQGDQEAFAALVQRHGPMVLAVCRRLLRDSHEASDAFQATFLVLVRKCPGLSRPDQLGPWLHRVAYRTASRLRQRAARRASSPEDLDSFPAFAAEPPDELAREEVQGIIDEEVQCLPGKYRLPVVLCYLQGQSYAEAAKSLGCPAGTVSARLARARERLRQRLARRGVGLSANLLGWLLAAKASSASVPQALLATTVKAGASSAGIPAGISQAVLTLTEGVLHTMWMQKVKTTMLAGVLVVGLCVTGLGSLNWPRTGQVAAQDLPTKAAEEVSGNRLRDDARTLEAQEQKLLLQLKEVREKKARLHLRRASAILDEIEASLKKLRQATAGSAGGHRAVAEFERAFRRLKADLRDSQPLPKVGFGGSGTSPGTSGGMSILPRGLIQDGHVLQVDAETKTALLSVGSKDGVKKGDVYRAYRGGKQSPDQTAWLRVTDVSAKWSIATITHNFAPRAPLQPQDIIQRHDERNNPQSR
jgi:RNA polymerase sigma factor (sigma-70 family)